MRIAILAQDSPSLAILVNYLTDQGFSDLHILVEQPVPRKDMLRFRIRRLGLFTTLGQVAFILGISPFLERAGRGRSQQILREHGLRTDPLPDHAIQRFESANAPTVATQLSRLAPDAVVVHGTRILRKSTLTAVKAPFLNIHAGVTPRYRGVHGGYWALYEGALQDFGVTLHYVDLGVDTGAAIARPRLTPTSDDSYATYPLLQLAGALPHLARALGLIAQGTLPAVEHSDGAGQQWFHPTLFQYLFGRLRGVK